MHSVHFPMTNSMKTKLQNRSDKRFFRAAVMTVLLALVGVADAGEPVQRWSTAITSIGPRGDKPRLSLDFIVQEKAHLMGRLTLENFIPENKKTDTLVIKGVQGADGSFLPNVVLQVREHSDSEWKTVASAIQMPTATLFVYPGLAVYGLTVELDAMRQFVGKYRLGKVVLKTGQEAEFDLNDLFPPSTPTPTP